MSHIAPYEILFEDDHLIVVNKHYNVLTVATEDKKTLRHNLWSYINVYLRQKHQKAYLVHRLDYETSGVVIFAKDEKTLHVFKEAFRERRVLREYEAVTTGRLSEHQDLIQYLSDDRKPLLTDASDGKEAITHLDPANDIQLGQVLKVSIDTGRHNQIRIALASQGLAILGDTRYGKTEAKRLYLNCYHIALRDHPGYDFSCRPLWLIESKEA